MLGLNKDKEFDIENYEDFYAHHQFVETTDQDATNVNELTTRFGWAYDQVAELKPNNLLDLGTLDGSFPITIAKHFGIPTTGVDLTVDGIALAKKRAERLGLPCDFHQGTVEEWLENAAKEGKKYDVVSFFELIEHVKDVPTVLKLIDGVLAPGGSVLVSTPDFESEVYGANDEKNKCHIRLYTVADEDYERANKYGNVRKATSMSKEIGPERIKELEVFGHWICCRYQ